MCYNKVRVNYYICYGYDCISVGRAEMIWGINMQLSSKFSKAGCL